MGGGSGESLQKNSVYFIKFRDNFSVPKKLCWERSCKTGLENTVWGLERADIRAGTRFAQAMQLFSNLNVTFPHLCVDVSQGGWGWLPRKSPRCTALTADGKNVINTT